MKTKIFKNGKQMMAMLLAFLILLSMQKLVAQVVCTNPSNVIYGLTGTGEVRPITVSTGVVGAKLNPPNTGTIPDLSNAMGYNQLNGSFYYFKRNTYNAPQEFVKFDPVANTMTILPSSPVTSIINLGCVADDSKGYYCIDALGGMYYFKFSTNTWTQICTNIRDQFGTSLAFIISGGGVPGPSNRIYGDIAIDGFGNMWILISGPTSYGLYELPKNLPTGYKSSLTITQFIPPTTSFAASIGGIAFNVNGEMFMSTNAGNNKLYKIQNNYSVTLISNLSLDGIGTDLTSCNYPLFLLSVNWINFNASIKNENALLSWTVAETSGNLGFDIEYSADAQVWESIGFVPSNGVETNNQQYSFQHNHAIAGKRYYRIVSVDRNGRKLYSESRMIERSNGARISIWPNPAQDVIKIETSTTRNYAGSRMTIYDQVGRLVNRAVLQTGVNNINIRSLAAGSYLVRIDFADGETVNQRFIKNQTNSLQ